MATETPATIPPKMKMTTNILAEITTPDSVETSLGTLRFFDGLPDKATVEKVFDNLDFMRGMDVFLNTTAATSTLANIEGLKTWVVTIRLSCFTRIAWTLRRFC
jgi:hypothetical protein